MGKQGVILIDKPKDITSRKAVDRVMAILKVKRAGHFGTLDPFATGLLCVGVGQGTKLSSYLMSDKKTYEATLRLGVETDTLDLTGRVLKTVPVPEIEPEIVEEKAKVFLGEIEQVPPAFSALKYKGRRAYDWARKGVRIDLHKRKVTIFSFKIISVRLPEILLEVVCSKGTYVRSLASDFAGSLGPGGHLTALRLVEQGADAQAGRLPGLQVLDQVRQRLAGVNNVLDDQHVTAGDVGLQVHHQADGAALGADAITGNADKVEARRDADGAHQVREKDDSAPQQPDEQQLFPSIIVRNAPAQRGDPGPDGFFRHQDFGDVILHVHDCSLCTNRPR